MTIAAKLVWIVLAVILVLFAISGLYVLMIQPGN